MSTNETIPHVSQADWNDAELLIEEGHDAGEIRELVAGNNKEVEVDGLILPAQSLGRTGIRSVVPHPGRFNAPLPQDAFPQPYENGRRA